MKLRRAGIPLQGLKSFFVELCTYRGPQRFGGKKDINDAAISKKRNTPEEKE